MDTPNFGRKRKRKTTETFHHNKPPFKRFTFTNMVEECHSTLTSDEESFPCSCSGNIITKFEESQEVNILTPSIKLMCFYSPKHNKNVTHFQVQSLEEVETSTCHDQVIRFFSIIIKYSVFF